MIGDPEKTLYQRLGVETSLEAILTPGAWRAPPGGWRSATTTAVVKRQLPAPVAPTNGILGLPADLLIARDGRIVAAKYGEHAFDQWMVDELFTTAAHFDLDTDR